MAGFEPKFVPIYLTLSEVRAWQIRKDDLDASRSEGMSGNHDRQDPFESDPQADPSHTPPRVCSVCGSPVGPGRTGLRDLPVQS